MTKRAKEVLKAEAEIIKTKITSQEQLIKVWAKSPDQNKEKLIEARSLIKAHNSELETLRETYRNIGKEPETNQADLFEAETKEFTDITKPRHPMEFHNPLLAKALDQAETPDSVVPDKHFKKVDVEVTHHTREQLDKIIPDRAHNMMDTPEDEVQKKKIRNGSQNQIILELFQCFPEDPMTPWEVNRRLEWPEKRITSTRRGITDLTKAGFLIKLSETKMEQEGIINSQYQIVKS